MIRRDIDRQAGGRTDGQLCSVWHRLFILLPVYRCARCAALGTMAWCCSLLAAASWQRHSSAAGLLQQIPRVLGCSTRSRGKHAPQISMGLALAVPPSARATAQGGALSTRQVLGRVLAGPDGDDLVAQIAQDSEALGVKQTRPVRPASLALLARLAKAGRTQESLQVSSGAGEAFSAPL